MWICPEPVETVSSTWPLTVRFRSKVASLASAGIAAKARIAAANANRFILFLDSLLFLRPEHWVLVQLILPDSSLLALFCSSCRQLLGEGNQHYVVGMSMRIAKGTVRCNFTDLFAPALEKWQTSAPRVSVCEHRCAALNNLPWAQELADWLIFRTRFLKSFCTTGMTFETAPLLTRNR